MIVDLSTTHPGVFRDARLVEIHFAELLELMPDGIVIVDVTSRIVYSNTQAEALFGYAAGELAGELVEILLQERHRGDHVRPMSRYFQQPRTRPMGAGLELRGVRKDGTEFPIEVSLSPLRTKGGTLAVSAIRDVSGRKQTEALALQAEKLLESELRFRQLAENIREVFYLRNADCSEILYVSPGYEAIWGRGSDEVYANPRAWMDSIHPDDRPEEPLGGEGHDLQYRIIRPDGEIRCIHDRGFPIRDESGAVYRIAGIAEDITARVALEHEVGERGNRLRRAQSLASLAHLVTGPDGEFLTWSDTLPALFGVGEHEMPHDSRGWMELVHPDDRGEFRRRAIAAAKSGEPTKMEYRLRRPDGAYIHLRQVTEPMGRTWDAAGGGSWFSTMQDVTHQKRAEDERRESDRRFSDMMAKVELISLMLDRDGAIIYCNDYLLRLTGWTMEEVLGRGWFDLFIPVEDQHVKFIFRDLLADQPPAWHIEGTMLTRTGERRLVRWNNSVLRSPSGETIGTASIGEDVTERRRAEDEVRRLNADLEARVAERTAELEAANKELEAYDYSISHDLRAPINRIRGFSEALLEDHAGQLDARGKEHLARIVKAADAMGQMVTDILRLSQWTKVKLHRTRTDLGAIAESILRGLKASHPERCVEWRIAPDLVANADPGLMRVALENLIGNAWKFTSKRELAVIELAKAAANGEEVFSLKDNGPGFDDLEAARLFMPFQRLGSSGQFQGSGVGLATVQRIVRRHGGRIWAEGLPEKGATFHVTLGPAAQGR
jgi:PAS domain S-box-containing protein